MWFLKWNDSSYFMAIVAVNPIMLESFWKLTHTVTCEEKIHRSIDMLDIEVTRITRQLKYYKP